MRLVKPDSTFFALLARKPNYAFPLLLLYLFSFLASYFLTYLASIPLLLREYILA